jgi:hypothetical protein
VALGRHGAIIAAVGADIAASLRYDRLVHVAWMSILVAGCGADLLNNQGIHDHVAELVAHDPAAARPADRLALTVGALVPIYGSYKLDHQVYGDVRPSAYVFDWVLGGLAPAALATASVLVGSPHTQRWLRWTAVGLYGTTRIAVMVVGNLHINTYDADIDQHTASTAPARVLAVGWTW